ncbi:MAG: hypothetical protein CSA54_02575 [Gammaproteobacteria bacterium]|nr:MAG: hypothetical protein CSA54_02575 [Gammaproteobacteria bacterium]
MLRWGLFFVLLAGSAVSWSQPWSVGLDVAVTQLDDAGYARAVSSAKLDSDHDNGGQFSLGYQLRPWLQAELSLGRLGRYDTQTSSGLRMDIKTVDTAAVWSLPVAARQQLLLTTGLAVMRYEQVLRSVSGGRIRSSDDVYSPLLGIGWRYFPASGHNKASISLSLDYRELDVESGSRNFSMGLTRAGLAYHYFF